MLIFTIKNLVSICGFFIILLTGQTASEETPIYISRNTYATISQHLRINPPRVFESSNAEEKYTDYFKNTDSNYEDSEVCQWGILADELEEPTNDICIIVAVALKDQIALSLSSEIPISSNYSNYECAKLPIVNLEKLNEIEENVIFCPRITITTDESITLERFLISDGDNIQNSIFVHVFANDNLGEINLMFYLDNILKIDIIKVQSTSKNQHLQKLYDLERDFRLNENYCDSAITEKRKICKYAAMRMVFRGDAQYEPLDYFDFNGTHFDATGFVPYRCFNRWYPSQPQRYRYQVMTSSYLPTADQIYCPKQVIEIGDAIVEQDGFFYCIDGTGYENRIRLCDLVHPSKYRHGHKFNEGAMLEVPMAT